MFHQISIRRKVEFAETDMAGLVHFSNYFRYVEAAEAALFERAEYPLIRTGGDVAEGWPRVRASAHFRAPLHFGDTIEVQLQVDELKIKAIAFKFRIYRLRDGEEPILAAKGRMTTVHTHFDKSTGNMTSQPIPAELAARLQPAQS